MYAHTLLLIKRRAEQMFNYIVSDIRLRTTIIMTENSLSQRHWLKMIHIYGGCGGDDDDGGDDGDDGGGGCDGGGGGSGDNGYGDGGGCDYCDSNEDNDG